MRKIVFLICLISGFFDCGAQSFPTMQRSIMNEDGVHTCSPCYTWAKPKMDSFKNRYGDSLICYSEEHGPYSLTNPLSSPIGEYLMYIAYKQSSTMAVTPLMWTNYRYCRRDSGDLYFNSLARHIIDSTNRQPAVASPIFWVTKIGTDSMIVVTKTKFMQNAYGHFYIATLLLQDSIYYMQAGAAGGWCYHMHKLVGPVYDTINRWSSNDSLAYSLAEGTIPMNTIFTDTFHFRLKPGQVLKNMHPLAVVWKKDTTVSYFRYEYVNANEKEESTTYINSLSTSGEQLTAYTAFVYPSPASEILKINLTGVDEDARINIYNITGQLILDETAYDKMTIDIRSLSAGQYIYLFRVKGNSIMKGTFEVVR